MEKLYQNNLNYGDTMHTLSIIKYLGSKFETILRIQGSSEVELLSEAKKAIDMESLKRYTNFHISTTPKEFTNSDEKIYNVFDDNAITSFGKFTLPQRTIVAYNIMINSESDKRYFEQKRIQAGFHAGF